MKKILVTGCNGQLGRASEKNMQGVTWNLLIQM